MTDRQRYDLLRRLIYVGQRVALASITAALAFTDHGFFAFVFVILYLSTPNYDHVRKQIKRAVKHENTANR